MGSLLAVYDPSGKLGLTDPSPGGGSVPTLIRLETGEWSNRPVNKWSDLGAWARASHALLLVTEDGTPDPIGMARAREVLARVVGLDPGEGVVFLLRDRDWMLDDGGVAARLFPSLRGETFMRAPEAIARLLAEHAGCEVIRG